MSLTSSPPSPSNSSNLQSLSPEPSESIIFHRYALSKEIFQDLVGKCTEVASLVPLVDYDQSLITEADFHDYLDDLQDKIPFFQTLGEIVTRENVFQFFLRMHYLEGGEDLFDMESLVSMVPELANASSREFTAENGSVQANLWTRIQFLNWMNASLTHDTSVDNSWRQYYNKFYLLYKECQTKPIQEVQHSCRNIHSWTEERFIAPTNLFFQMPEAPNADLYKSQRPKTKILYILYIPYNNLLLVGGADQPGDYDTWRKQYEGENEMRVRVMFVHQTTVDIHRGIQSVKKLFKDYLVTKNSNYLFATQEVHDIMDVQLKLALHELENSPSSPGTSSVTTRSISPLSPGGVFSNNRFSPKHTAPPASPSLSQHITSSSSPVIADWSRFKVMHTEATKQENGTESLWNGESKLPGSDRGSLHLGVGIEIVHTESTRDVAPQDDDTEEIIVEPSDHPSVPELLLENKPNGYQSSPLTFGVNGIQAEDEDNLTTIVQVPKEKEKDELQPISRQTTSNKLQSPPSSPQNQITTPTRTAPSPPSNSQTPKPFTPLSRSNSTQSIPPKTPDNDMIVEPDNQSLRSNLTLSTSTIRRAILPDPEDLDLSSTDTDDDEEEATHLILQGHPTMPKSKLYGALSPRYPQSPPVSEPSLRHSIPASPFSPQVGTGLPENRRILLEINSLREHLYYIEQQLSPPKAAYGFDNEDTRELHMLREQVHSMQGTVNRYSQILDKQRRLIQSKDDKIQQLKMTVLEQQNKIAALEMYALPQLPDDLHHPKRQNGNGERVMNRTP